MKNLKTTCTLIMGILLLSGVNSFAAESNPITSVSEKTTIHVEYTYNAYGIAISSTQKTVTTTTTTNEKGETSTTTTTYISVNGWRGGSLKIETTTGTSQNESVNGANSTTEFWTNYAYNDNGQLKGASGGGKTKGNRGKDDNGNELGTFESESEDIYEIRNGQAIKIKTVNKTVYYGPEGQKESDSTETTTYEYELIGGSWQLMKEVSVSNTEGTDGSSQTMTKTKVYQRDANGVCIGITQTASGTQTAVNGNGGRATYNLSNYDAKFAFDEEVGWYLADESWDWVEGGSRTTPPADNPPGEDNPDPNNPLNDNPRNDDTRPDRRHDGNDHRHDGDDHDRPQHPGWHDNDGREGHRGERNDSHHGYQPSGGGTAFPGVPAAEYDFAAELEKRYPGRGQAIADDWVALSKVVQDDSEEVPSALDVLAHIDDAITFKGGDVNKDEWPF